jgi:hypothetical protein
VSTNPSTTDRRAELRADMDARMRARLHGPLPAWLASRRNRRAVALLPPAVLACGLLTAVRPDDTVGTFLMLGTLLLGVSGILLLRRASRLLDAVPDRLLDEREIGERDAAYRRAHTVTVSMLALLWLFAIADGTVAKLTGAELVVGDNWIHVLLTAMLVATMTPAAVIAWQFTDPIDDND